MNSHGVRSKYSPRVGYVTECGEETKVQQHFKDQCDINKIARSVEATGSSDHVKMARERYGDFTEILDIGVNMDKAAKAQQLYEQLPVEMRKKTGNSIPEFFKYIQNPENLDECVKWGIFDKPSQPPAGTPGGGNDPAPQATKTGKMKAPAKVQEEPSEE